MSLLIDDAAQPSLRVHIGRLLSTCARADIAVSHVRLPALDLTANETRRVQHCRILLGRLEARALMDFGFVDEHSDERLHTLLQFLGSGRVEIRSAGLGAWSPDFSIYRELSGDAHGDACAVDAQDDAYAVGNHGNARPVGRHGSACLIGAHYFRDPMTSNGPSFTALLHDADAVACALARFEALWERSHDVLEPVVAAIRHRQSFSAA